MNTVSFADFSSLMYYIQRILGKTNWKSLYLYFARARTRYVIESIM